MRDRFREARSEGFKSFAGKPEDGWVLQFGIQQLPRISLPSRHVDVTGDLHTRDYPSEQYPSFLREPIPTPRCTSTATSESFAAARYVSLKGAEDADHDGDSH